MHAYPYAMMLLSRQDYTEKKLAESLSKKGFDEKEVEGVVRTLVSEGIVDDLRYAKMYVESKKKNYGRRRLEFFLREKRIEQDVIDEALTELDEEEELCGALETARKKYRILCSKSGGDGERKKKLFDALMRAGYSVDIAKKAVDMVSD